MTHNVFNVTVEKNSLPRYTGAHLRGLLPGYKYNIFVARINFARASYAFTSSTMGTCFTAEVCAVVRIIEGFA